MKRAITIFLTAIFLLTIALPLLAQSPLTSDVQAEDAAPSASSVPVENSVAQGDGVSSGVAPASPGFTSAEWERIESFYQNAVDDAQETLKEATESARNVFIIAATILGIVAGLLAPLWMRSSNKEDRKEVDQNLEEIKAIKKEIVEIQVRNSSINLAHSMLIGARGFDALIRQEEDKGNWKYTVWACENGMESSLSALNGINMVLGNLNEELLDGHRRAFKLSIQRWTKAVINASRQDWKNKVEALQSYSEVIEKGLNEIRASEKDKEFLSFVEQHHNEIKRIIQEMRSSATGEKNEK